MFYTCGIKFNVIGNLKIPCMKINMKGDENLRISRVEFICDIFFLIYRKNQEAGNASPSPQNCNLG